MLSFYENGHLSKLVYVCGFYNFHIALSSVQLLSHVWLFATPWKEHARTPCPSQTPRACSNSSFELMMPSNHLILCDPFSSAFNLSQHQGRSQWVVLHSRWPKYWSWSFSLSPSNEYSGLISFRINWLDLLKVQGTLKRLLQHHTSKASIL